MKNDFRTLEQKIRQIMMSEKEKNVTQPAELDDINENTFEVKYAERKKGPIKVNKFKKLEDAKEFLSTVRAAGSNGIISKDGKPVKEDVELDEYMEQRKQKQMNEGFILRTVMKMTGLDKKMMKAFLILNQPAEMKKLADKAAGDPKKLERLITMVKQVMAENKSDSEVVVPATKLLGLLMTKKLKEEHQALHEISKALKGRYMKGAIEDIEWFAGAEEYAGLDPKSRKQWDKRKKNLEKLIDQLTKESIDREDVEHLDELKKSTLRSYIDKASYQARRKTSDADHNTKIAKSLGKALAKGKFSSGKKLDREDKDIAKRSQKSSLKKAKIAKDKANKRYKGIARAADKITRGVREDVEQINELKKDTLASYTKKAAGDMRLAARIGARLTKGHIGYEKDKKDNDRILKNRQKGINRAADRLAREETQIDGLKKSTKKEACWTGYKQAGMKKKGDKMVPNCVPENYIDEKAVSQAQQKLMGMAYAYKKGELEDASETVKKIASSMSMKKLRDFAKTKQSVSEGYLWREYEPGEYSNGEEKRFVDLIKKNGGKNISVEKPTRREPNLHIEFEGGNLSKMRKDLDRIDDGGTNLEEAVSPAQQAAIAISKKKLKKMNTEATDKDSISNKELKSVGKGKKDKIKINPKMQNDKQIDNTSEEM